MSGLDDIIAGVVMAGADDIDIVSGASEIIAGSDDRALDFVSGEDVDIIAGRIVAGSLDGGEEIISGMDPDLAEVVAGAGLSPAMRRRLMALPREMQRRIAAAARRKKAALTQGIQTRNAAVVQERPLRDRRLLPMGFDSGATVAAGATVNVTQRPQEAFRLRKLTVPSDFAGSFLLNSIFIGNKPQNPAQGIQACRVYQEDARSPELICDTCPSGIDIILNVTNIAGGNIRFLATGWGDVVR